LSSLDVKPVETSQFFFGLYKYSVRFDLQELGIIRGLNPDKIDQLVKDRNRWRAEHRNIYGFGDRMLRIDAITTQNLKDLCQLLVPHQDQIKLVISYNRGYVYTNNFDLVETLANLPILSDIQIQEAKQICPPGTIALKNPLWSHRTYFRSKSVDETQRKALIGYLQNRENVRLSPGLKEWVEQKTGNGWWTSYTHTHFFLDHNNDGELLFLNMVVPNITRKSKQIVAK